MRTAVPPECPRCRYDLSGETARWTGPAPEEGRCSECGSTFLWHDVLAGSPLRWLYDRTPRGGPGLRRAWGTFLRILNPARFWTAVATVQPASLPRLLLWLPLVIVPAYALNLCLQLTLRYLMIRRWGAGEPFWPPMPYLWELLLHPIYDAAEMVPPTGFAPIWFADRSFVGLAAGSLAAGATLLCFVRPEAHEHQVTPLHVLRATVYGLLPLAALFVCTAAFSLIVLLAEFGLFRLTRPWYDGLFIAWMVVRTILLIWLLLWWYFAAVRGLRTPRTIAVAAAVAAGLVFAIVYLGHWSFWWFFAPRFIA